MSVSHLNNIHTSQLIPQHPISFSCTSTDIRNQYARLQLPYNFTVFGVFLICTYKSCWSGDQQRRESNHSQRFLISFSLKLHSIGLMILWKTSAQT